MFGLESRDSGDPAHPPGPVFETRANEINKSAHDFRAVFRGDKDICNNSLQLIGFDTNLKYLAPEL